MVTGIDDFRERFKGREEQYDISEKIRLKQHKIVNIL